MGVDEHKGQDPYQSSHTVILSYQRILTLGCYKIQFWQVTSLHLSFGVGSLMHQLQLCVYVLLEMYKGAAFVTYRGCTKRLCRWEFVNHEFAVCVLI